MKGTASQPTATPPVAGMASEARSADTREGVSDGCRRVETPSAARCAARSVGHVGDTVDGADDRVFGQDGVARDLLGKLPLCRTVAACLSDMAFA